MSKKTELLKNTLMLAFGKLSTQLIAFLLLPIYTSFLSPQEFGFYDLVMTYVVLLAPMLTIQMEMSIFRHLVDARRNRKAQVSIVSNVAEILFLTIGVVVAVALILNQLLSIQYLNLITILLAIAAITGVLMQLSRGLGNNKAFMVGSILLAAVSFLAVLWFVVLQGMGMTGMFLSAIVANAAAALYLIIVNKVWELVRFGESSGALKKDLVGYALPLVPNGAALWVVSVSDRTIISIMIDVAANGIYAIANKFPLALMGLFSVFNMSWTESVSLHINSNDKDRDAFLSDAFNAGLRLIASLGLVTVTVMHFVFPLLVDEQFGEAYLYIPILILGIILSAAMSMFGAVYVAKKMTKKVAMTSLYAAILNVILTIALIPVMGLYGAATATVISFGAMVVIRHFDLRKYICIKYDTRGYLLVFCTFLIVSALYYLGSFVYEILSIVIALAITFMVNRNEIQAIWKKLRMKVIK